MKLYVFSSSRKIKEYYQQSKGTNALIDQALSVAEFLDKICLSQGFRASAYEQLLLMQEACKKSQNLEQKLGISTEFFAFLKNNEYLFSFFRELALENKSIKDLQNSDYYASYNEHLEILDCVFQNYLNLLKRENLYDELSLPLSYTLNLDFLEDYESIIYDLEGFLSHFELSLLLQIAKHKELILRFKTSKFNLAYFKELPFLKDVNLKENYHYEFNITQNILLKKESLKPKSAFVKVQQFELRILQVAFVLDEISSFIRAGLKAEDIVVITPDESFCDFLRLLDQNNMLNYASGVSIKESLFYQRLRSLYESANLDDFHFDDNKDYFNEAQNFDLHNSLLHYFELDFKEFKEHFTKECEFSYFETLIKQFLANENSELRLFVEKELFFIKNLLTNQKLNLKQILELFFIQISSFKQSYVGGGAVTAMGILESRGLSFDGVIVVDFNEDLIPKRSVNELFLNNEVRTKAGLISYEKRENLQRFYYEQLFKNAKKISICYVENEEKSRSRLLEDLEFRLDLTKEFSQKAYLNALKLNYKAKQINLEPPQAPKLKHNLFATPLSYSRLTLFLESKRTYFYKYIKHLKEPRELKMDIKEQNDRKRLKNLGIFIHRILELYYKHYDFFDEKLFASLLENEGQKEGLDTLDLELLKIKFKEFAKKEQERFKQGYHIKHLELNIDKSIILEGQKIELTGKIDRIDSNERFGELILDYKSGKIPEKSYQLAFYKLLYDENAHAAFYDLNDFELKEGKDTKSIFALKEELEKLLKEVGKEIIFENEKSDFCPYKLLYEKDLK
ncbi:PD-(D/E)XK nuclease family protein [Campylobacter upsaliensis]|uniref:PD-(D/E)XK nuclease family protein n=1 Tax=Campylobacter upsaliensis TaxID=28080 RepID=UPI0021499F09|nr:PD-(D/E)XK nuclease family protein [Campylobacter upsaliensis]ELU9596324.1 PD-(D/E)XK nuclease family protein [Campylobacter upsaliensis]MCR2088280.1 PD-(D/E)XK nuclease family protein [Campylobacter upsaliensis]